MEEGRFGQIVMYFYNKLNTQFLLLYLQYMSGRELVENVRIPSYGGRGLKLLKKPSYYI